MKFNTFVLILVSISFTSARAWHIFGDEPQPDPFAGKKCPYKVLGISKAATSKEIRRTFLQLSKKYHPDVSKEEDAADKYKEINEAYEILNNTEKRRAYDEGGFPALMRLAQGGGDDAYDINDIFSSFFGFGGGRNREEAMRAEPLVYPIAIPLDALYHGQEVGIRVQVTRLCKNYDDCEVNRPDCQGHEIRVVTRQHSPGMFLQQQIRDPTCVGRNKGWKPNCKIVIEGRGQEKPGLQRGHIIFIIEEKKHQVYRREGNDLHRNLDITLKEALLGFNKTIDLFGENIKVAQTGVTPHNHIIKIAQKGMPSNDHGGFGDMYISVNVIFPKRLTDGQIATWKGHIRRAIEIKDQLTFKHIAILIHSCANARIDGKQLQSLVHGLQGNIMAYLERSLANIATGTTKIELYHIYSILHGVIASGYSNPEMTVMLKEAAMVQFRNLSSDAGEESIKPFIFEDIAGIIHALAQMQAEVDQRDITMIHNVFVKLYEKDTRGESTISHRAFAIIVNTLDRLGCHTQTLGQIISEYIQRHVHAMNNIKDVAMIYCTATRIYPRIHNIDDGKCYNWATRTRIGQTMALTGDTTVNCGSKEIRMDNTFGQCDIIHLTSLVIRQLIQPDDPGGNVYSDVKSIANIAAHAAPFAEIADEELLEQFGVFIGNAIQRAMQNTTIDHTSLVHLMSCAIRLNRTYDAMIMLSSDNIDCVGMLATPQEFAKHMANIHALRSKQSDEKVTKIMDSIAVTNMLHFQYRLERPPLTIKPKPQRRRNLRDLIIAESKKDSHVENICIFNDLDKHFKGPNGFSLCAKTLAAIGVFSGHKSAVEIAQRMVTTMQHICAFDNIYTNVESIAAAATGLYR
ncbi:DnaJ protein ERDJ3B [Babesia sp. Xinjiang]|uniref:DnaJ protein ERDJ3B n=1 Tax=Babesia sp. Xinjiang TaxID=462227 RepID=UPI000A24E12E|nr:DnaJ protein ERDJ3B [Babesia sp. Xinjiang]ORM42087.1 DnaJ protein ERDJ3B [Babesia sp. Xinjiang]